MTSCPHPCAVEMSGKEEAGSGTIAIGLFQNDSVEKSSIRKEPQGVGSLRSTQPEAALPIDLLSFCKQRSETSFALIMSICL